MAHQKDSKGHKPAPKGQPPTRGVHTSDAAPMPRKAKAPGDTNPILGLKNALRAAQTEALARQIAEQGFGQS